jgi:hypothetical protein
MRQRVLFASESLFAKVVDPRHKIRTKLRPAWRIGDDPSDETPLICSCSCKFVVLFSANTSLETSDESSSAAARSP